MNTDQKTHIANALQQAFILHAQGELQDAERIYLDLKGMLSNNPNYLTGFGILSIQIGKLEIGEELLKKSIRLNPNQFVAYANRAAALSELKRFDDSLKCYNKAITLDNSHAEIYYQRGMLHQRLGMYDKATLDYEAAFKLAPHFPSIEAQILISKAQTCNWDGFDTNLNSLSESPNSVYPFQLLSLVDNPQLQLDASVAYVNNEFPVKSHFPSLIKYQRRERINLGYFSADFHDHATMHLMAELFEHHDKGKFRLIAFSFGPQHQDYWRKRVQPIFDDFIDVTNKSDEDIARLARELEIDIAIDLKGFTGDSRTNVFSYRTAPIQVNYLGYPGTMGAEFIDYIIADQFVIPAESKKFYSEKIAYLPYCYQPNCELHLIEHVYNRTELGLPENSFVFCCFNNNYKVLPSTFDIWMDILISVEGSILWLLESHSSVVNNLRKEAVNRGVDSNRIIFAPQMPRDKHLSRMKLADLFLDTLPYNAHTTASDALRVGLPLLSLPGETFASRVAGSLLNSVGLNELIAQSRERYKAIAIELGNNQEKLQAIKTKLLNNLPASPLYNSKLFTQRLESGYIKMYERYQEGLSPDNIYIN